MACLTAFCSSFPYTSGSQRPSMSAPLYLNLCAGLRITPQLTALKQPLRRCCSSQRPKEAHAVSCTLGPEDGAEDSDLLESTQRLPIKSISCIQDGDSFATYRLVTGLATMGIVGTTYLTFVKLSGGAISCPLEGGGSDVAVFGLPLPEVGAFGYGIMALLGWIGTTRTFLKIAGADLIQRLLLGSTSAMAGASVYLMYIISTKLEGVSCIYDVASVLLCFSLLLLTLQSFNPKEVKQVGLHLAMSALVVLALSTTQTGIALPFTASTVIDLPPVEPNVTTSSSAVNVSLAKHLQSVGAKMYGAFWCSHCFEQKQMFGREAIKYLDYVECYPEGVRKGVTIAKACDVANIKGFPTWIIKGERLSGERELSELARVAGFDGFDSSK